MGAGKWMSLEQCGGSGGALGIGELTVPARLRADNFKGVRSRKGAQRRKMANISTRRKYDWTILSTATAKLLLVSWIANMPFACALQANTTHFDSLRAD